MAKIECECGQILSLNSSSRRGGLVIQSEEGFYRLADEITTLLRVGANVRAPELIRDILYGSDGARVRFAEQCWNCKRIHVFARNSDETEVYEPNEASDSRMLF